MLLPVVVSCAMLALSPLRPIPSKSGMIGIRGSGAQALPQRAAVDDAGKLLRVLGIGRIPRVLQALGETVGVARALQHASVTRVALQQLGVIVETFGIRR